MSPVSVISTPVAHHQVACPNRVTEQLSSMKPGILKALTVSQQRVGGKTRSGTLSYGFCLLQGNSVLQAWTGETHGITIRDGVVAEPDCSRSQLKHSNIKKKKRPLRTSWD